MTRDNNNNMRRRPNNGGRSNNNNTGRSGGGSGSGGGMNRRPRHSGSGGGHYRSGGGGEVNVKQLTQAREKYVTLAREALSANEKTDAEYYYQHVEHYSRMLKELGEQVAERQEQRSDAVTDENQGNRAPGAEHAAQEQNQPSYRRPAPQRSQEAAEESAPAPIAAAESTEDTAPVIS